MEDPTFSSFMVFSEGQWHQVDLAHGDYRFGWPRPHTITDDRLIVGSVESPIHQIDEILFPGYTTGYGSGAVLLPVCWDSYGSTPAIIMPDENLLTLLLQEIGAEEIDPDSGGIGDIVFQNLNLTYQIRPDAAGPSPWYIELWRTTEGSLETWSDDEGGFYFADYFSEIAVSGRMGTRLSPTGDPIWERPYGPLIRDPSLADPDGGAITFPYGHHPARIGAVARTGHLVFDGLDGLRLYGPDGNSHVALEGGLPHYDLAASPSQHEPTVFLGRQVPGQSRLVFYERYGGAVSEGPDARYEDAFTSPDDGPVDIPWQPFGPITDTGLIAFGVASGNLLDIPDYLAGSGYSPWGKPHFMPSGAAASFATSYGADGEAQLNLLVLIGTQRLTPGSHTSHPGDVQTLAMEAGDGKGTIIASLDHVAYQRTADDQPVITVRLAGSYVDPLANYLGDGQDPQLSISGSSLAGGMVEVDSLLRQGEGGAASLWDPLGPTHWDFEVELSLAATTGLHTVRIAGTDHRTAAPVVQEFEFYVDEHRYEEVPIKAAEGAELDLDPAAPTITVGGETWALIPGYDGPAGEGVSHFWIGGHRGHVVMGGGDPAAPGPLPVSFTFLLPDGTQAERGNFQETAPGSGIYQQQGELSAVRHRHELISATAGRGTGSSPVAASVLRIAAPPDYIAPGGILKLSRGGQPVTLKPISYSPEMIYAVTGEEDGHPIYDLYRVVTTGDPGEINQRSLQRLGRDGPEFTVVGEQGEDGLYLIEFELPGSPASEPTTLPLLVSGLEDEGHLSDQEVWDFTEDLVADYKLDADILKSTCSLLYGIGGELTAGEALQAGNGSTVSFRPSLGALGEGIAARRLAGQALMHTAPNGTTYVFFAEDAGPMGAARFLVEGFFAERGDAGMEALLDIAIAAQVSGHTIDASDLVEHVRQMAEIELARLIRLGWHHTTASAMLMLRMVASPVDLALTLDDFLDGRAALWEVALAAVPFVSAHHLGMAVHVATRGPVADNGPAQPAANLIALALAAKGNLTPILAGGVFPVAFVDQRLIRQIDAQVVADMAAIADNQKLKELLLELTHSGLQSRKAIELRLALYEDVYVQIAAMSVEDRRLFLHQLAISAKKGRETGGQPGRSEYQSVAGTMLLNDKELSRWRKNARAALRSELAPKPPGGFWDRWEGHHYLPIELDTWFISMGMDPNTRRFGGWIRRKRHSEYHRGVHSFADIKTEMGMRGMDQKLIVEFENYITNIEGLNMNSKAPYNHCWTFLREAQRKVTEFKDMPAVMHDQAELFFDLMRALHP